MPADEQPVEPPRPSLVRDEDRGHWAFRKLAAVEPPKPDAAERVRTPIDAFILARLEQAGLGYSSEADRVTLIRRAHVDRASPVWTGFFSPLEKATLVVDHASRNIVDLCDIVRPSVVDAQANGEIRADLDVEFTCEWLARICMTFVFDPANLDIDDDKSVVEFFRMNLAGLA